MVRFESYDEREAQFNLSCNAGTLYMGSALLQSELAFAGNLTHISRPSAYLSFVSSPATATLLLQRHLYYHPPAASHGNDHIAITAAVLGYDESISTLKSPFALQERATAVLRVEIQTPFRLDIICTMRASLPEDTPFKLCDYFSVLQAIQAGGGIMEVRYVVLLFFAAY
jgi:hypothetical protein